MFKVFRLSCLLAGFLALAVAASAQEIPGQKPMVVIADTFQFLPGTWAEYTILDKEKDETYRFNFAVLTKEIVKGLPCWWIEIEVESASNPMVVTRFLAEETPNGPGDLKKAVVQVEGYSAFSIPAGFLRGDDAEVGQVRQAHIVKRVEERSLTHAGKTINAVVVEAKDEDARRMSATVSLELPPIALFFCEDETIRMSVNDWGGGATSKIKGPAMPFFLWIMEQVTAGTDDSKSKKTIKKTPLN